MPHVDLETLMCGGDRKIACETLIDGRPSTERPETAADFPAESFRLPIEEEVDWFDRNAFYERKQSTKGISSANSNPSSNLHTNGASASQRFYLNLKNKASIIGLPKLPDSGQLCQHLRPSYRRARVRFFPKSTAKQAEAETEPGSPKVSCIGRVRPKEKNKNKRRKDCRNSTERSSGEKAKFWSSFLSVFRFGRKNRSAVEYEEKSPSPISDDQKMPAGTDKILPDESEPDAAPAPGLAGLKKFSSYRRSASWGGHDDLKLDLDVNVGESKSSDGDSVWCRRARGRPQKVDCSGNWAISGPASC